MNAPARLNDLAARDAKNREFAQNSSICLQVRFFPIFRRTQKKASIEKWENLSVQAVFLNKQYTWREKKLREAGENATNVITRSLWRTYCASGGSSAAIAFH